MGNAPVPVLFDVGGIHYQHVFVLSVIIDQQIVNDTARFIRETGILYFTGHQHGRVVGSHLLDEFEGMGTFYPEFSHVRDIEDTDRMAHSQVFIQDTGVFYRHVIAGKFMHFGTESDMFLGKGGCFHTYQV